MRSRHPSDRRLRRFERDTGDTLMAVANAAGTAMFNYQFFGEIDKVLTMTATQADPAATAMTAFTVTG